MKNRVYLLMVSAIIFISIFASCGILPNPDRCVLCALTPSHAPYLVNLHTGDAGVLEVCKANQMSVTEMVDNQDGGIFSFVNVAGVEGNRDTGRWEVHIPFSVDVDSFSPELFCSSCQRQILQFRNDDYIIVDKCNSGMPTVYDVDANKRHTFRTYEISVIKSDNDDLEIIVRGCVNP